MSLNSMSQHSLAFVELRAYLGGFHPRSLLGLSLVPALTALTPSHEILWTCLTDGIILPVVKVWEWSLRDVNDLIQSDIICGWWSKNSPSFLSQLLVPRPLG